MPRKGKGSKTQPIQTASGQQYGEVAAQEQAQQAVPLPQNVEPSISYGPPRRPRQTPGQLGAPFRQSARPNEAIQAAPSPTQTPQLPPERARLLAPALHVLYSIANNAYADPDLQATVRHMENFVPTKYDQPL